MAVKLTEEQKKAIETLDRSILVSAAAGSGKTAVLVRRILNIILEGKANVDEMLVVTFTKAAAAEMRLRLGREIRKRMREHPEEAVRLNDQLSRLYRAYISTIDSFALRILREFFYEIDMEPDFGTCDQIQSELLRREAAAELLEEGFADDGFIEGCSFREFMRLYSDERSEENFKEDLLTSYSKLRTMPDYFNWAYDKAELLKTTEADFDGSELKRLILEDTIDSFRGAAGAACKVRDILYDAGLEKMYAEKLAPEVDSIIEMYEELAGGRLDEELMARAQSISYARMSLKKEYKEAYEPIKEEVKALRDIYKDEIKKWSSRYLIPDFATRLAEMNRTYDYTVYYLKLLEEFEKLYMTKKQERHMLDFADMEHYAVRILGREEVAATLRNRFRFIFVDEYQDTNNIQEYLISKVSRPDNVFKVGDLKQSIYKFRQAEPEIFKRVYQEYSDPSNEYGIAIDLSRNFRSNDATVRFINRVFENVMEGYDDRARLYTGCACDSRYDFIPEVHILTADDADSDEEAPTDDDTEAKAGQAGDAEDEIEDLSKEEAEAAYIADLVSRLIGTEFHDTGSNEIRKAKPGDIVILYRAMKSRGEIMTRALMKRGIESHIEDSDDYFDTVEIGIALSLLTCVDNMKRDVSLIATLHSGVFGWTPEDLAEVRIAYREHLRESEGRDRRAAYWEALEWFAGAGPEGDLRDRACSAVDKIMEWRQLAAMMPLGDFVWKVLTDSGCYRMVGAMNGGARRQANLRVLADRADKYSHETISSLSSYISFIDLMKKRKINNGQASVAGADDDVVRICSIHKSKGLEYPFVIVGNLGRKIRYDKAGKGFSCDSDAGIGLPYVDPSRRYWRSTLIQRAIDSKSRRDVYNEELRILYVALTRARNKLILVGTCSSIEELDKYTVRPANYLKVIKDVIYGPDNMYYIAPLDRKESSLPAGRMSKRAEIPEVLSGEAAELYDEIDRRFRFEYSDSDRLTSKAKYSVSEIRRAELEREAEEAKASEGTAISPGEEEEVSSGRRDHEVVGLWTANEGRKKASAADIGIAYHRIMEYLDFSKALTDGEVDEAYIRESCDYLAGTGAIDKEVYKYIDIDKIAGFFRSDIGRRAAAASGRKAVKKEKAFTLRTVRRGREMLVQGVIDCCFEEDGSMILIDYKSSFIRPGRSYDEELERIRHEYSVQIELYAEAIKKGTGLNTAESYLYLFASGEALRIS